MRKGSILSFVKKLPLSREEFRAIYSKVPRLCVEVVIKTEKGVVLTLRSIEPYKGLWHIPGGTVYFKERLVDAVRRVAKDEVGVEVEIEKLLGYIEYPDEENYRGFGWPVGVAFLVKIVSGKLTGSEQGEEVREFTSLPENMVEPQKEFLEWSCGV